MIKPYYKKVHMILRVALENFVTLRLASKKIFLDIFVWLWPDDHILFFCCTYTQSVYLLTPSPRIKLQFYCLWIMSVFQLVHFALTLFSFTDSISVQPVALHLTCTFAEFSTVVKASKGKNKKIGKEMKKV